MPRSARDKQIYLQRRAAGLCVCCAAPAVPGSAMCASCGAANRERSRARRAAGIAPKRRVRQPCRCGRCGRSVNRCDLTPYHGARICPACLLPSYPPIEISTPTCALGFV